MIKMKKQALVVWSLLVLPLFGLAQTESDSLSLQALVYKAMHKNTGLKNAQLEIEKSEKTKSQINNTFLPTLEADGKFAYTAGKFNIDTQSASLEFPGISLPTSIPALPVFTIPGFPVTIPAIDQTLDFDGNLWIAGITAKWTIFTGFKASNLSKAMTHKIEAQKHMFTQEEADLISEIAALYDKIALLAQTQNVLDIQSKRLEKENETATKALGLGLITKHEYQKIEIAQLNIASKILEFEGAKELLYLKLHQLTGVEIAELETIEVDIEIRLESETSNKSFLDRPELLALDESVLASEFKYKSEISGYLPKVQAFASHQYLGLTNGQAAGFGFNEISGYPLNMVGVGMKWEIFDGFHTRDERQKIKIEMQQTQNRKEEVTELLELNYRNCVSQYANLTAQTELKAKQMESSKESLEISYKEYKNGLVDVSDYLEAQSEYTTTTLEYYKTVCDQRNSALELLKATGSLQIEKL
ncbi:outer membrane efflux protein [Formosa agariphila KMM 3901]|uniref:Outer membrane efflux protein n=2 Tax=Formosa TaxID=225842 RepID=T2KLW6_FORAG|nr:outer membrane efflux protein [Formosa agariphila KMM 3901]